MSGVSYLLDTNVVIGIFKAHEDTLALLESTSCKMSDCAVSQITRMELLSYSGLQKEEEVKIISFLTSVHVLLLCEGVEKAAVQFRKVYGCKLPDAIIAATAMHYDIQLITLDKVLQRSYNSALQLQK